MKKILWLVSWYPNENDPFNGDFIKRQAEAVAIYQPLKIIYVGKSFQNNSGTGEQEEKQDGLQENILYYHSRLKENTLSSKIRSLYNYLKKNTEFIRLLKEHDQLPNIVHVQVAMKAGLIALYMKWKYKIPYVLTEHWTGYYPQSEHSLFKKSFLERYLTKKILKNAARLLPVSCALGNQISHQWVSRSYQEIPNVVNTKYFYPDENSHQGKFRFIHVSTLLYQKNPEGLIRAFTGLINRGIDAELVLVGPLNAAISKVLSENKLFKTSIHCTGEISYEQVAEELRKSSAFVLFSFYENMPCVILEALCIGIPVIATRVGGISEVIGEHNGILIDAGDENSLMEVMTSMVLQTRQYDREKISRESSRLYSYETVGEKIIQVYDSVLTNG
jgi:glycosyltransferase involved in cell wall biosynthesis